MDKRRVKQRRDLNFLSCLCSQSTGFRVPEYPNQSNDCFCLWQSLLPTWCPSKLLSVHWKCLDTKSGEPASEMWFCWWGDRTNPRRHFAFLSLCCPKASYISCPQSTLFWVNPQTNQKTPWVKKENLSSFAWASPPFLNTQLCQHLLPLTAVKTLMLSSFLSLLVSLDYCETCYLFPGKVKELFHVGSLQKPQGTKCLLSFDLTVPLLLHSVQETFCPEKIRILVCRLKNIHCTGDLTTYFQSAVFKTC